jgi:hypothetical protein
MSTITFSELKTAIASLTEDKDMLRRACHELSAPTPLPPGAKTQAQIVVSIFDHATSLGVSVVDIAGAGLFLAARIMGLTVKHGREHTMLHYAEEHFRRVYIDTLTTRMIEEAPEDIVNFIRDILRFHRPEPKG